MCCERLAASVNWNSSSGWVDIQPDAYSDWLDQRKPSEIQFSSFIPLNGGPSNKEELEIFQMRTQGVVTGRDPWSYNFSDSALRDNISRMIDAYERDREAIEEEAVEGEKHSEKSVEDQITRDDAQIKWSKSLIGVLKRGKRLKFEPSNITLSHYRPFTRMWLYYDKDLVHSAYRIPHVFPHQGAENQLICVNGKGEGKSFSTLMLNNVPNLHTIQGGYCFPRWVYQKKKAHEALWVDQQEHDSQGYGRDSAISPEAKQLFGDRLGRGVSDEAIFYYVYGLLHDSIYRERFAISLLKDLPPKFRKVPIQIRCGTFKP